MQPAWFVGGHGHERRAVTFDAAVVEVAGGLIDMCLAAERCLYRLHR